MDWALVILEVEIGYKLHIICNTNSPIVPLTADVTTANMSDNQVYPDLTASLSFSGLLFPLKSQRK